MQKAEGDKRGLNFLGRVRFCREGNGVEHMNIVWLTPEIPYPPYGGRNGVFNRIVQMSKYHSVFLFSIAYSDEEKRTENEMREYCAEVHYYNRNQSKAKTLFKSLLLPYSVASRTMRSIQQDLKKLSLRISIDYVILDFPNMARNVEPLALSGVPMTLNQHNVEYRRMRELSRVKTIPFYKRIAYYLESFRLELYEGGLYKKNLFKTITFFSEDDMALFQKRWRKCNAELAVFPLGANRLDCKPAPNEHTILFVGRLDEVAIPNVEAVIWFYQEILPSIEQKVPNVRFIIAGANPSDRILGLASERVEVIPNYSKVQDVYEKAACVVLPILSGGGVKGKLLEAASMKRIIVTTSHGIEGTRFSDREHVLLANSADDFASACVKALTHPQDYADMIDAAYKLFRNMYDWEEIGEKYSAFLLNRRR